MQRTMRCFINNPLKVMRSGPDRFASLHLGAGSQVGSRRVPSRVVNSDGELRAAFRVSSASERKVGFVLFVILWRRAKPAGMRP